MEVETKNHDLQVMQKSLERLRKEKQLSYTSVIGMYIWILLIIKDASQLYRKFIIHFVICGVNVHRYFG